MQNQIVNVSWTFGNFEVAVEVEITPAQVTAMLQNGAKQVLQRSPSSDAEKLCVLSEHFTGTKWKTGKKGGVIRPEGFERDSIPYSKEMAEVVKEGFGVEADIPGDDAKLLGKLKYKITGITEHVGGETSPMKRAQLLVDSALAGGEEGQKKLLAVLGLYGMVVEPVPSRVEMIEYAHSKGLGMDRKK